MLVVILVIVAAVAYLYYFTTLPESELNGWINSLIPGDEELIVNVERVNRDIWDELVLEGVSIAPKIRRTAPEVRISKIKLTYDPLQLIKDRSSFRTLTIDSIDINIPKSPPIEDTPKTEKEKFEIPVKANIELIEIKNAYINIYGDDNIYLDSLVLTSRMIDDGLDLDIHALAADLTSRNTSINLIQGHIKSNKNGYEIDSLTVVTDLSNIYLAGTTGPNFSEGLDIAFEYLGEIDNLFGVRINGLLAAKGIIRGSFNDFQGQANIDGMFMKRPFDNVNASYRFYDKKLEFSSIVGDVFHASFDGSGIIDFDVKPEKYVYHGSVDKLDLLNIGQNMLMARDSVEIL
jgi:autotransporter translocation and assembly factor TamB